MRKKTIETIPVLSVSMEKILSAFPKSRSLPSGLVKRSNIVLLATLPGLREIEAADPEKLEDGIRAVLSDKKRPGAPSVFTPDQIMKIIDLACSDPSGWGYEVIFKFHTYGK